MSNICILNHSESGQTLEIAKCILEGLNAVPDNTAKLFDITDFNNKNLDLDKIREYDALIFGCPTHFGDITTEMKKFFDSTTKIWLNREWADKFAAGFTNSGSPSGDKVNTIINLFTFASQHSMNWISCGLPQETIIENNAEVQINPLGGWSGLLTQTVSQSVSNDYKITAKKFGQRIAFFLNNIKFKS